MTEKSKENKKRPTFDQYIEKIVLTLNNKITKLHDKKGNKK